MFKKIKEKTLELGWKKLILWLIASVIGIISLMFTVSLVSLILMQKFDNRYIDSEKAKAEQIKQTKEVIDSIEKPEERPKKNPDIITHPEFSSPQRFIEYYSEEFFKDKQSAADKYGVMVAYIKHFQATGSIPNQLKDKFKTLEKYANDKQYEKVKELLEQIKSEFKKS